MLVKNIRKMQRLLCLSLCLSLSLLTACSANKLSSVEESLRKEEIANNAKVKPVRKDLNLAIPSLPRHYQPELPQNLSEKAVLDQIYEGLVTFHNNRLRLQEAETIEPNTDFTKWTIKLRDDLYWSDGSKLTALDYQKSWLNYLANYEKKNAALKAESYRAWLINKAEAYSKGEAKASEVGIKAQDNKLIITLNRSYKDFPAWLTQSFFYPSKKDQGGNNLYNGAYVPEKISEQAITLIVNNKHWDSVNVWLKKINISVIKDEVEAYEAYHSGNIDFIGEPFYPICKDRRQAALKSAEHLSFPLARLGYIKLFNLQHPLFADSEKRQILYELLDAPFQANVLLQDGSKVWPPRDTPTQVRRDKLAVKLKQGLHEQELDGLTEDTTVGLGGPNILENRLLVATSKDWLNALRVRFLLQRLKNGNKAVDFAYCVDLAPAGSMESLLALWSLNGKINLDSDITELVWASIDKQREAKASLQQAWSKLPETSAVLPLTTRDAFAMVKPHLIGVNVDKTGKMLLSDLQWKN